jgi:hypothetical protein
MCSAAIGSHRVQVVSPDSARRPRSSTMLAAEGGVAVAADPERRARRGDGGNAETRAAQGREGPVEVGRAL